MARDSAPSFQFYPRDFMADPAVQAMPWDMRGRYVWALCCSSLCATPGKASEVTWREWMGYRPSRWPHVRERIVAAFHVEEDGSWTQRRMVQERAAQRERFEASAAGGRNRASGMTPEHRSQAAREAAKRRWFPDA